MDKECDGGQEDMKALVIAPSFFGYDKAIVGGLGHLGYDVDFLDSEQLKPEYWALWNKSFLHKVARHVIPGRRTRDRKRADAAFSAAYLSKYLEQIDDTPDAYSLVLTVKGDFIQDDLYSFLKKNNPRARFLLYLWDDVSLLHRKDYFSFFDKVFSYSCLDCEEYGLEFLPIFVQDYTQNEETEKKYDIAIIGSGHKERVRFVKRLYGKYKDKYSFFIYFVKKPGENNDFFANEIPMAYPEYMSVLQQSKCVLDDPLIRQKGPTARVCDSIRCRTKVLTTNRYLKMYPVNSDNVQMISRHNPVIPAGFIESPVKEESLQVPDVTEWLKKMINTK